MRHAAHEPDERGESGRALISRRIHRVGTWASLLVVGLLAGCMEPYDGEPEAMETASPLLSYEEITARIPLSGTDEWPLFWEIDLFEDPLAAEAGRVPHYYEALTIMLDTQRIPDPEDLQLLDYFLTEEYARRVRSWFPSSTPLPAGYDYLQTGPRWFRVVAVDIAPGGTEALVTSCMDLTWYAHHPDGVPRDVGSTGWSEGWGMISYTLHRETVDGDLRWRIARKHVAPSDHAKQYADECRRWADHSWPPESASPESSAPAETAGRS